MGAWARILKLSLSSSSHRDRSDLWGAETAPLFNGYPGWMEQSAFVATLPQRPLFSASDWD